MDHYHGELDASPEQLGEYACPNGHSPPSPVAVSCTCGARVSCVPLSEALALQRQLTLERDEVERLREALRRVKGATLVTPDAGWVGESPYLIACTALDPDAP